MTRLTKAITFALLLCGGARSAPAPRPDDILRGTWVIDELYSTYNIAAFFDEQLKFLIGSKVEYRDSYIISCLTSAAIIKKWTSTETKWEFFRRYRGAVHLSDIAIFTPSVVEVHIDHVIPRHECLGMPELPGDEVIIKDNNNIVISFEGHFLRAHRKE